MIGAATGRELALSLRGDLEGAAGGGPQLAREDRTIGQRVSADDRRSRPFEQLNEQAADRSQTDDDRGVARLNAGAPHGAQTAGQRLDERRGLVADVRRHPEGRVAHVGRGHADVLGEPARIEIRGLERGAHRLAAPTAVVTVATRDVVSRHDTIPDGVDGHARADGRHFTDDLVTEHRRDLRGGVDDLRDVRSAETAPLETQEELAVADRWPGPVFGDEPPTAAVDGGLHATRPPPEPVEPNRAAAQQRNAIATLRLVGTVTRSPKT